MTVKYANELDDYLQGAIFSDDPSYYDADTKHFYDQAGFDHLDNGFDVRVGTPTFSTKNGRRCWSMDNTCHVGFIPAIPWQGSFIMAFQIENIAAGGNYTTVPLRTGGAGNSSARSELSILRTGSTGNFTLAMKGQGGGVLKTPDLALTGPTASVAIGVASSQASRTCFITTDGVTVTESSPAVTTDPTTGDLTSFFMSQLYADIAYRSTLGNLDTIEDTTVTTSAKVHLWEFHSFKNNVFTGSQASKVAQFFASLKARYLIP